MRSRSVNSDCPPSHFGSWSIHILGDCGAIERSTTMCAKTSSFRSRFMKSIRTQTPTSRYQFRLCCFANLTRKPLTHPKSPMAQDGLAKSTSKAIHIPVGASSKVHLDHRHSKILKFDHSDSLQPGIYSLLPCRTGRHSPTAAPLVSFRMRKLHSTQVSEVRCKKWPQHGARQDQSSEMRAVKSSIWANSSNSQ